MRPLSHDDLVPLDEYAGRRREYFEAHCRYVDGYRRVRVGPSATLLFENRQTLWFRVQEVLCIARLTDAKLVQQELNLFNRLLPGPGQLQAALAIDVKNPSQLTAELAPWAELAGEAIRLCVGHSTFAASILTCRVEDRCVGTAHWLQFTLDPAGRQQLADLRQPAALEIALPAYHHRSPPLSDEIRLSLLEDLKASDQAVAPAA